MSKREDKGFLTLYVIQWVFILLAIYGFIIDDVDYMIGSVVMTALIFTGIFAGMRDTE